MQQDPTEPESMQRWSRRCACPFPTQKVEDGPMDVWDLSNPPALGPQPPPTEGVRYESRQRRFGHLDTCGPVSMRDVMTLDRRVAGNELVVGRPAVAGLRCAIPSVDAASNTFSDS
jgi:hypothetical protein